MKTYKMFIDDERSPAYIGANEDDFVVVRTSKEANEYIAKHGMPSFISFDHDLGGDDTAMRTVRFIINGVLDGILKMPNNFSFDVHSANPVGAANIRSTMSGFVKYLDTIQEEVSL